ncbi:MAG: hypothetical protein SGI96_05285 [Bacteroidota bacterium]|nr:hypothetical protein [Bacteroidota bacterium]
MQSPIEHIENIISKAGDLAETKAELWKLKAAGKIAETMSSVISMMAIALISVASISIISIGGALWIGHELGNSSYGFFIVGGFYILAGLLIYIFRKNWIKGPLNHLLINKIMK